MLQEVNKAAFTVKSAVSEEDMQLINHQALRELTPEEVYAFKVQACNTLVDRDFERFTEESLVTLASLYVGKTMIVDHNWSAKNQRARIYQTYTAKGEDGSTALMAKCYMLRNETTKDIIAAIEGGILREVSVGCAMGKALCSICGEPYGACGHRKGTVYDGELCVCELHDPVDAYEMSFVAVPAQPKAGVTKSANGSAGVVSESDTMQALLDIENERWRFV